MLRLSNYYCGIDYILARTYFIIYIIVIYIIVIIYNILKLYIFISFCLELIFNFIKNIRSLLTITTK